ncbi:hypothetical protein BX070DRAFT_68725 [Coemansia spiralis]|nr:hypothetical protein BX070DRAFT_68725 [Coemansia spiralis]
MHLSIALFYTALAFIGKNDNSSIFLSLSHIVNANDFIVRICIFSFPFANGRDYHRFFVLLTSRLPIPHWLLVFWYWGSSIMSSFIFSM